MYLCNTSTVDCSLRTQNFGVYRKSWWQKQRGKGLSLVKLPLLLCFLHGLKAVTSQYKTLIGHKFVTSQAHTVHHCYYPKATLDFLPVSARVVTESVFRMHGVRLLCPQVNLLCGQVGGDFKPCTK